MPPCFYCKHKTVDGGMDPAGYKCRAFPEGVPLTITTRVDRHETVDAFFGDQFAYESEVFTDDSGEEFTRDYEGRAIYSVS